MQLLLKDPRVDVTLHGSEFCTPLWWASCFGNLEVIEWLIASGKDLGYLNQAGKHWTGQKYTVLGIAQNYVGVVAVLERFLATQYKHA